jgi:hypothetical protein
MESEQIISDSHYVKREIKLISETGKVYNISCYFLSNSFKQPPPTIIILESQLHGSIDAIGLHQELNFQ